MSVCCDDETNHTTQRMKVTELLVQLSIVFFSHILVIVEDERRRVSESKKALLEQGQTTDETLMGRKTYGRQCSSRSGTLLMSVT